MEKYRRKKKKCTAVGWSHHSILVWNKSDLTLKRRPKSIKPSMIWNSIWLLIYRTNVCSKLSQRQSIECNCFFAHLVASKITIKSFRMLERGKKKLNLTCVKKPTVVYRPDSIMQKWFPSHSIRLQFLPCMLVPSHCPTAVLTNYNSFSVQH